MEQTYWVYILLCENNSLYTGYTNNLEKRFQAHQDGTSKCKFTRSFKPIKIAQAWVINDSKKVAMRIERSIKKLKRIDKEKIIAEPAQLAELIDTDFCLVRLSPNNGLLTSYGNTKNL